MILVGYIFYYFVWFCFLTPYREDFIIFLYAVRQNIVVENHLSSILNCARVKIFVQPFDRQII